MNEPDREGIGAYVRAAATLTRMPLAPEREPLVAAVVARLAELAAELTAFPLADDDEPAGVFLP